MSLPPFKESVENRCSNQLWIRTEPGYMGNDDVLYYNQIETSKKTKMKLQGTRDSVYKSRTKMSKSETKSVLFVRILAAFSPVPHRRMCNAAVITPLDSHRLGLGYLSIIPFSSSASDVVAAARIDGIGKVLGIQPQASNDGQLWTLPYLT
jgi:hypothetical protein